MKKKSVKINCYFLLSRKFFVLHPFTCRCVSGQEIRAFAQSTESHEFNSWLSQLDIPKLILAAESIQGNCVCTSCIFAVKLLQT